jgi:hypothetical protein
MLRAFLTGYYGETVKHLVLEEPTKEWPETILKSCHIWQTKNILLLPDVRFSPASALQYTAQGLQEQQSLSLALHTVPMDETSKFGMVSTNGEFVTEKPIVWTEQATEAWGILGFTKDIGEGLFKALGERTPFRFPKYTAFTKLKSFKDLTRRKGIVESYET